MVEIVDIALSDLLVDHRNARLKEVQPSQPAAIIALAKQQGRRLLQLAEDIVKRGLDPTALTAVVATADQKARYTVIEGNRRVVALKALETPSLVAAVYNSPDQKRLHQLAEKFQKNPISIVKCALGTEEELQHWVTLRHTGLNDGVGLVEWGADEKDRYNARHGTRSPAGQILDFVEKAGLLPTPPPHSAKEKGIITSLTRLINTERVRERLGIELIGGNVATWYPPQEIAKGLSRVVDDLKSGRVKVQKIYTAEDRKTYANELPKSALPTKSKRLPSPKPLIGTDSSGTAITLTPRKARRRAAPRDRTALIPKTCGLNIATPRINNLYNELLSLSVDQHPNACSVTMRVFLELSVDTFIDQASLMTSDQRRNSPLAKRMKVAAAHLRKKGAIGDQLEAAVKKVADGGSSVLAASVVAFHQYVHNPFVFPKPSELRTAWDELQPFMEKLWP